MCRHLDDYKLKTFTDAQGNMFSSGQNMTAQDKHGTYHKKQIINTVLELMKIKRVNIQTAYVLCKRLLCEKAYSDQ